jgi:hypothetical protein
MRSVLIASTAAILLGHAVSSIASDALPPDQAERIRPVIPAAIEYYNERVADPLPALTSGQIEELLAGGVARIRRRPDRALEDPPERVTGYRLIRHPRDQVWIAALDPSFQATDLLSEARLQHFDDGSSLWHQYLSLPWPVTDRQWVIRVGQRRDLAEQTQGLVWEQYWQLADDGERIAAESLAAGNLPEITPETAKDAIYVPANEGSWVMFRIEDDVTLVAYRIVARVGGNIPDSWIATFGMAQLGRVLDEVARHAGEIPDRYDPDVQPFVGGDGKVIGRF